MGLVFTTEIHSRHLRIAAAGASTLANLYEMIEFVWAEFERTGKPLILVDLLGIEGKVREIDEYSMGQRAAEVFGATVKIAFVCEPAQITRMGENTAVNRGARMKVVSTEEEGLEWLL